MIAPLHITHLCEATVPKRYGRRLPRRRVRGTNDSILDLVLRRAHTRRGDKLLADFARNLRAIEKDAIRRVRGLQAQAALRPAQRLAKSAYQSHVDAIVSGYSDALASAEKALTPELVETLHGEQRGVARILRKAIPDDVLKTNKGGLIYTPWSEQDALNIVLRPWGEPHPLPYAKRFANMTKTVRTHIQRSLASGLARGEGMPWMIRQITHGTDMAKTRATRIVRTEVQRVSNDAHRKIYADNEDIIKAEKWVATLDADTCVVCGTLDGREFLVGTVPLPAHPVCRCTSTPVVKSWRELGIDADEISPGTRSSMNGYVPQTTRYPEWFSQQGPAFQRRVLGPARYALYKDGKLDVKDFVQVHRHRVKTLKELAA